MLFGDEYDLRFDAVARMQNTLETQVRRFLRQGTSHLPLHYWHASAQSRAFLLPLLACLHSVEDDLSLHRGGQLFSLPSQFVFFYPSHRPTDGLASVSASTDMQACLLRALCSPAAGTTIFGVPTTSVSSAWKVLQVLPPHNFKHPTQDTIFSLAATFATAHGQCVKCNAGSMCIRTLAAR